VGRRDEICANVSAEVHFLDVKRRMGESLGDAADMAFETGSDEVTFTASPTRIARAFSN